jgi:hypothetical protein
MNEFGTTTAKFYRHSGKAPILGLILIGLAGFIAVPILGLLYGVLIRVIPFIYINVFIVLGYAYAVGFVLSSVAKYGKVRNMFLLGLAGFFFGALADYVGWVSWLAVLMGDPSFLIGFFFPADVLYIITMVAEEGAWSIKGTTPTGGFLYFIWFIEACTVIGGSTYLTVTALSKTPFCEDSDAWADKKSQIGAFAPLTNPAQFKRAITQGNFSAFNELKPSRPEEMRFTTLELFECVQCRNFFVLNVDDVTVTIDNKGKANTKTKSVLSNLLITPHQLASLKRLAEPPSEPAALQG